MMSQLSLGQKGLQDPSVIETHFNFRDVKIWKTIPLKNWNTLSWMELVWGLSEHLPKDNIYLNVLVDILVKLYTHFKTLNM